MHFKYIYGPFSNYKTKIKSYKTYDYSECEKSINNYSGWLFTFYVTKGWGMYTYSKSRVSYGNIRDNSGCRTRSYR